MKVNLNYILIALLIVSLGFNAYHYCYQFAFVRGQQAGANLVSNSVVQQFKETGKVQMMHEGKQINLVPENPLMSKGELQ